MNDQNQKAIPTYSFSNTIGSFFSSHLKDSALFILILTGVSYLITAIYKLGYLSYYGIPISLTTIETIDIIHVAIALVLIIAFLLLLPIHINNLSRGRQSRESIYVNSESKKNKILVVIGVICFEVVVTVGLFYSGSIILFNYTMPIKVLCILLVVLAIHFSLIFLKKGYGNLTKEIINSFNPILICTIFLPLMLLYINNLGENNARSQTKFLTTKLESKVYIVTLINNDNLIVAPLDADKKTILPHYKIIKKDEKLELITVNFPEGITVKEPENIK